MKWDTVGDQPFWVFCQILLIWKALASWLHTTTQKDLASNQSRIRCNQHLHLMQIAPHIDKSEKWIRNGEFTYVIWFKCCISSTTSSVSFFGIGQALFPYEIVEVDGLSKK